MATTTFKQIDKPRDARWNLRVPSQVKAAVDKLSRKKARLQRTHSTPTDIVIMALEQYLASESNV